MSAPKKEPDRRTRRMMEDVLWRGDNANLGPFEYQKIAQVLVGMAEKMGEMEERLRSLESSALKKEMPS